MLSRGLQMRWLSGAERAEAAGHGLWVVETSSQPCWILVHLCRSHKSQGQRSKGKVKGDAPRRTGHTPRGLLDRGVQHGAVR